MLAVKRLLPAVCSSLVMFLILMLLGSLMTPQWSVAPYTDHVSVQSSNTAIAAKGISVPHEGSYRTKESRITIKLNDSVSINAIVREPIGASGKRPACLFLHGAGTGDSSEVYGDVASAMSSAGIVTLVPDKRLDNYSMLHRDYPQMAKDYGTSFDVLKQWPSVDAGKVGLYAESEGTWISSLITAERKDVAYSILTSAPVVSGRQQMSMAASAYFADSGAPESLIRDVPKLTSMDFSAIGLDYANFDSTPYLRKLTQPVLVNYGVEDLSMPIEQGTQTILKQASSAGNDNVTVRYYQANHQMRTGSHLSEPGLPLDTSYTRNLEDWINSVTSGATADSWATPQIAGARPSQRYAAPLMTPPGLVASLGVLIALMVSALGFCLLSGILALGIGVGSAARSAANRQRSLGGFGRGIKAPLTVTVLLASLSLTAALLYVGNTAIKALSLQRDASLFLHGWIMLRIAAIALVLVFGWLCSGIWSALRRHDDERVPPATERHQTIRVLHGVGHIGVMLCGILGSLLVMVSLAFWGLYTF
ncbi:MAG: alpha/beta hydrolase [Bifidobacterium psychraerophilum]|uniref:alpha/beta hydrolase family protein n=1 Tax=Bifidobacterium psychraerophilum TaxID=218140 RepID=UPI0039EA6DB8